MLRLIVMFERRERNTSSVTCKQHTAPDEGSPRE